MSASSSYVTAFCQLAREKGLDPDRLLENADIDPAVMDTPEGRIPSEKLASVVVSIWDQLEDETMGQATQLIPRGAFNLMGKVAVGEPTLRSALRMGIRFYSMVTGAYRVSLEEDRDLATLRFDMQSPQQDKYFLFAEITLMAWHRLASWLISEHITLHEIYFDYAAPGHVGEYTYLFPGQHVFNAEYLGFSFSKCFLERDISQTRDGLVSFMKNCPMELFVQPKQDFSISSDLKKLLRKKVAEGFPLIEEAADALHMNKRTLMRKLKDEGTSYQEIKDLVRRDRAVFLLKSHTMPISEIAEEVGFSDPAVFARSFKSWTGVSPRDYRAASD